MRNKFLRKFLITGTLALFLLQGCKDDSYLTRIPPPANQSFNEEFDTATAALSRGWQFINASEPLGSSIWQNGGSIPPFFNAFSNNGSNAGFIGVDYLSTSAEQGTISNWLVSPPVIMQNGDKIIFYTRARQQPYGIDTTDFGNSVQLRLNTINADTNVGNGLNPGNFTKAVLIINPQFAYSSVLAPNPTAYPAQWTRFEATIDGISGPVKGRFGFRYFVLDGGSKGNGTGIGIDAVSYKSAGH